MGFVSDIKLLFGYHHKFLIYNILSRNLKLKYRKSYLGFLWTVLVPGANALVYYFVFHAVMHVQIPNHLLFLFSGMLPWVFYQSSIVQAMESLLANHRLLNKVPIPPHIFPLGDVLTSYLNFLLSLPVLILIQFLMIGFHPLSILILLFFSTLLLLQVYCVGLILSYIFIFMRDIRHIISIVLQIWFYLTPIVYTVEMIPEKYKFILYLNPVAFIFNAIHLSFAFNQSIPADQLLYAVLWTLAIFVLAYVLFRKFNHKIIELI